ncbi:MAG TPA: amino acid permease [Gaiellaceae bacterium]|nr:amino acid permease [Gaiellaceae bacterium]
MNEAAVETTGAVASEDARLESLGYQPQLRRVLGFFANFAVAFTYLSPMVGIYSLFVLGAGTGGPGYVWLTWLPVAGMLLVALVFGELASHYPIAGALYQYSKYNVGRRYGWFVGWFYGIALLVTVASVDTGVVPYVTSLFHNWFGTNWNPTHHSTILIVTIVLLAIQTTLNITGAQVMGDVAKFGVGVEILGTFAIAIILAIHGFHHGLGFLFSTQGAQHASSNVFGVGFGGSWLAVALIAVLAPVYIFYGFESAGDIAEETKDAGRQIPKSMRWALIWGGIASLVLTGALLLAMPKVDPIKATFDGGGVPFILGQLSSGMQDFLLVLIIFAFFSCGTSVQGAGSRLAFSFGRDGALPAASWISRINSRFRTPVNALLSGAVISLLFVFLVYYSPSKNVHIWFITYPANINALYSLISFGVSGIYLSFLLTVIGSMIARRRGWVPEGRFQLGTWGWTVSIIAAAYLGLMLLNVVVPTGLTSGRGLFNYDWITLFVMVIIAVVGAIYFFAARPDRKVATHLHDSLEPSAAER